MLHCETSQPSANEKRNKPGSLSPIKNPTIIKTVAFLRPLRSFREALFPPPKKDMNPRSINYMHLVFMPKQKCSLFASYPASGWNWSIDVMSYALGKRFHGTFLPKYDYSAPNLKKGEEKPFVLFSPADSRATNIEQVRKIFPSIDLDYAFHTHGYWGESPLLGLDQSKTVLITRNFVTALFSQYSKRRGVYDSFEAFLNATGSLQRIVRFYNTWETLRRKKPENFLVLSYESFKGSPIKSFQEMLSFAFDINIDETIICEALDYYSFNKQKEREALFSSETNNHFHYQGKLSYQEEINEKTHLEICKYLKDNLISDFGYHLS